MNALRVADERLAVAVRVEGEVSGQVHDQEADEQEAREAEYGRLVDEEEEADLLEAK